MVQAELFHNAIGIGKQRQRDANQEKSGHPPVGINRQSSELRNPGQVTQAQKLHRDKMNRTAGAASDPHSERVRLRGRIGRYFDVKRTQSGTLLAVFSIATVKPYRDESGNWQKKIAWQRIVVWGEAAQTVGEQLQKGAQVQVEGKLKTREWTDSENRLHTTTELVARDIRFVDAAENGMAA